MKLYVEPDGESEPTACDCCGNESKTVWGYIYNGNNALAAYFIQWTKNKKEHYPNFDFLLGTWGDDSINDKKLISFIYNATQGDNGSFMAIDGSERPASSSELCDVALSAQEVRNDKEIMNIAAEMIDAVWLGDPRIEEIRNFNKNA